MRILAALAVLVLSFPVAAAESAPSVPTLAEPLSGAAVFQVLFGLLVVIAVILLLAWAVRRVNVLPGQRSGMQVVAVLPLGQRERAVLVQVGGQQLLLGVCANQVTLLHAFDEPVVEPRQPGDGAFARKLQEIIRQRGGA